jgi:ligand-binding sensor domain-containing protein
LPIREGTNVLEISAGTPWSNGSILLATNAGLRVYDRETRRVSKVAIEDPQGQVQAMARDGLNRLWLGGERGLWIVDAGKTSLRSFDRVPWIQRNSVTALASDPQHKDGMIVGLGSRGGVFIRARPTP